MAGRGIAFIAGIALAALLSGCAAPNPAPRGQGQASAPGSAQPRVLFGAQIRDLQFDPTPASGGQSAGVRIEYVLDRSPAEAAGLRENDIVLTVAGKETASANDFAQAVTKAGPAAVIPVVFLRDGQAHTASVALVPRPPDADARYTAYADTQMKRAQQAGLDAEKAGDPRAAFAHDLRALRMAYYVFFDDPAEATRVYDEVLARIGALLPALRSRPAIPSEADRHNRRALAMLQSAASDDDNDRAAAEFGDAIYEAPWVADLYLNVALVSEKAGNAEDAARTLRRYLLLDPAARNDDKIKQKLAALDVLIDERKPWLPFVGTSRRTNGAVLALTLRGRNLTVTELQAPNPPNEDDIAKAGDVLARGTIHGRQFIGKTIDRPTNAALIRCFGAEYELDAEGTIDAAGTRLTIRSKSSAIDPQSCQAVSQQWESWGDFAAAAPH